jgi:hypothetical protein
MLAACLRWGKPEDSATYVCFFSADAKNISAVADASALRDENFAKRSAAQC